MVVGPRYYKKINDTQGNVSGPIQDTLFVLKIRISRAKLISFRRNLFPSLVNRRREFNRISNTNDEIFGKARSQAEV